MPSRSTLTGSIAISAAWLVLGVLFIASLYLGLALWVGAWRYHPEIAELATFTVCIVAAIGGLALVHGGRSHGRDDSDGDDDDDGGSKPPPSNPPAPRGPHGTALDWDGFDRARADWDRVGAGV